MILPLPTLCWSSSIHYPLSLQSHQHHPHSWIISSCYSSSRRFLKPSWVSWWGAQSRALPTLAVLDLEWTGVLLWGWRPGYFNPYKQNLCHSSGQEIREVEFALGTLDQGLLTPSHTGPFLIWHTWAKVQSKNACSFPSASPPYITLRHKLARTSLELLVLTEAPGSAHCSTVLRGPSQPYFTAFTEQFSVSWRAPYDS